MPPVEKKDPLQPLVWWTSPFWAGSRAADMGHLAGGGTLLRMSPLWELLAQGHECGILGACEGKWKEHIKPSLVWTSWDYRKPELHTPHLSVLPKEAKPECPGTEIQEPAPKSLPALPPWQPAIESVNLNRLLSAFLLRQSINCRMHMLWIR